MIILGLIFWGRKLGRAFLVHILSILLIFKIGGKFQLFILGSKIYLRFKIL